MRNSIGMSKGSCPFLYVPTRTAAGCGALGERALLGAILRGFLFDGFSAMGFPIPLIPVVSVWVGVCGRQGAESKWASTAYFLMSLRPSRIYHQFFWRYGGGRDELVMFLV